MTNRIKIIEGCERVREGLIESECEECKRGYTIDGSGCRSCSIGVNIENLTARIAYHTNLMEAGN